MFGGPNPSSAALFDIYASNNVEIALAMARIASGKRVMAPSDDFIAYQAAAGLETTNERYSLIKQDVTTAQGFFDFAASVGDTIVTDLVKLYTLKELYDAAVLDPVAQANYKAQYDATIVSITATKAAAFYDIYPAYQAAALYKDVTVNTHGDVYRLTPTAIADETAINDITTTTLNDIQTEITNGYTYTAQVKSGSDQMKWFSKFADTVINSNQASISAITGVNDLEEMTLLTNLQVRQQAAVAMMAQANMVLGYAALLYGGKP